VHIKRSRATTDVDNFNEVIIIFINGSISRDINAACKKIRSAPAEEKSRRRARPGTKDNNNFSNHSTFVHLSPEAAAVAAAPPPRTTTMPLYTVAANAFVSRIQFPGEKYAPALSLSLTLRSLLSLYSREREMRIMMSLVKFGPRGRNQIRTLISGRP
jgi:hypothetical protein